MSNDDIIRSWKEQHPQSEPPADTPPNPAGEGELPSEDLDTVAGGSAGTYMIFTFGCCPDLPQA